MKFHVLMSIGEHKLIKTESMEKSCLEVLTSEMWKGLEIEAQAFQRQHPTPAESP